MEETHFTVRAVEGMKITTAWACAWIATGLAVCVAIYITKSAGCLWAMFIPALVNLKSGDTEKVEE